MDNGSPKNIMETENHQVNHKVRNQQTMHQNTLDNYSSVLNELMDRFTHYHRVCNSCHTEIFLDSCLNCPGVGTNVYIGTVNNCWHCK